MEPRRCHKKDPFGMANRGSEPLPIKVLLSFASFVAPTVGLGISLILSSGRVSPPTTPISCCKVAANAGSSRSQDVLINVCADVFFNRVSPGSKALRLQVYGLVVW